MPSRPLTPAERAMASRAREERLARLNRTRDAAAQQPRSAPVPTTTTTAYRRLDRIPKSNSIIRMANEAVARGEGSNSLSRLVAESSRAEREARMLPMRKERVIPMRKARALPMQRGGMRDAQLVEQFERLQTAQAASPRQQREPPSFSDNYASLSTAEAAHSSWPTRYDVHPNNQQARFEVERENARLYAETQRAMQQGAHHPYAFSTSHPHQPPPPASSHYDSPAPASRRPTLSNAYLRDQRSAFEATREMERLRAEGRYGSPVPNVDRYMTPPPLSPFQPTQPPPHAPWDDEHEAYRAQPHYVPSPLRTPQSLQRVKREPQSAASPQPIRSVKREPQSAASPRPLPSVKREPLQHVKRESPLAASSSSIGSSEAGALVVYRSPYDDPSDGPTQQHQAGVLQAAVAYCTEANPRFASYEGDWRMHQFVDAWLGNVRSPNVALVATEDFEAEYYPPGVDTIVMRGIQNVDHIGEISVDLSSLETVAADNCVFDHSQFWGNFWDLATMPNVRNLILVNNELSSFPPFSFKDLDSIVFWNNKCDISYLSFASLTYASPRVTSLSVAAERSVPQDLLFDSPTCDVYLEAMISIFRGTLGAECVLGCLTLGLRCLPAVAIRQIGDCLCDPGRRSSLRHLRLIFFEFNAYIDHDDVVDMFTEIAANPNCSLETCIINAEAIPCVNHN